MADERPDLLGATRAMLQASGVPWVIENVRGAPMSGFTLTGEMFGLGVHRPRKFEVSYLLLTPVPPPASRYAVPVYGKRHDGRLLWKRKDGTELRAPSTLKEGAEAMGIDWLPWEALKEAIPPAYTEWIGRQLIEQGTLCGATP